MSKRLCIVHRDRRDLFEELSQAFRDVEDIQVIFDRRISERRRANVPGVADRRRGERRQYRSDLRMLGWILTWQEDAGAIPMADVAVG